MCQKFKRYQLKLCIAPFFLNIDNQLWSKDSVNLSKTIAKKNGPKTGDADFDFFAWFSTVPSSKKNGPEKRGCVIFCAAPCATTRGALGVRDSVFVTVTHRFLEENWFRGFSAISTSRNLAFPLLEKHQNACPGPGLCLFFVHNA